MVLLDGFEVSANDLARIEPDNIAQFLVLKDATAAALYGSKGANGVILAAPQDRFFFQGQGRSSFFINPGKIASFMNYRNALSYIAENHWSPNNPVSHAFWPRLTTAENKNNYETNSMWWLRNGRLLRLKSLEIGYSLPQ